jgi:hypothetical protein
MSVWDYQQSTDLALKFIGGFATTAASFVFPTDAGFSFKVLGLSACMWFTSLKVPSSTLE